MKDSYPRPFLLLVLVVLAPCIIVAGFLLYQNQRKSCLTEAEHRLLSIADLKVGELSAWRKERLADAGVFYKNSAFSTLVRRCFEQPDDLPLQEELRSWIGRVQASYRYDRVDLLDATGNKWMSVPGTKRPVSSITVEKAREALRSGKLTFGDFRRNEYTGEVCLRLYVPIYDGPSGERPLGVLMLRIDPSIYLYPLIQRWPTPSETAETLLICRKGNEVVFLNELKFQKNTALALRVSIDNTDLPAVKAAHRQEGIVEGIDYRGVPVLAAVHPVPDSPWFMVARMDITEVYAPMWKWLLLTVLFVGILLFGLAATAGFLWRQQRVRFYRERAESKEMLREKDELLRQMSEMARIGGWEFDPADGQGTWTDEVARIHDMDPAAESNMELGLSVYQGESRRKIESALREAVESGRSYDLELEMVTPSGKCKWVRTIGHPVKQDDRVVKVRGAIQDITESKLVEEALRANETMLNETGNIARIGGWEHDLLTGKAAWTRGLYDVVEIEPGEHIPGLNEHLDYYPPQDRDILQAAYQRAVETGEPFDLELRCNTATGRTLWARVIGRPTILDGKCVRMSGTFQDVTKRKQAEETVQRTARELQEKNAELERFLYTASHDLKSPVVTIRTFLGYLEHDMAADDAEKIEKDMRFMRTATENIGRLLDELLEVSRVGRVINPSVHVTFRNLADEALDVVAGRIAERGVTVNVADNDLTLFGDRLRFAEIWQNLIENACKFMGEQREPLIEIGAEERGAETVFFVRDNGMGIAPRYHAKIFTLFEKLDTGAEGTGLGLALVKRIVELYQGRIWVESSGQGKGSCFYFTLPKAMDEYESEGGAD